MGWYVESTGKKFRYTPSMPVKGGALKALNAKLAMNIIEALSSRNYYPKELAKKMGVHEQKIYYHIRNLERAGIISVVHSERHQGAMAKVYALTSHAFTFLVDGAKHEKLDASEHPELSLAAFFDPFIVNGAVNCKIVIGSPDPHGPSHARSRDMYNTNLLSIVFGSLLSEYSGIENVVVYDTDITPAELKENLIVIGGPIVNSVIGKINAKLPIRFEKSGNMWRKIYSKLSGKTYTGEHVALIVKMENPFNKDKKVMVIGGIKIAGTLSSILAIIKKPHEIMSEKSRGVVAHVIEGIDRDMDGKIDDVEIFE